VSSLHLEGIGPTLVGVGLSRKQEQRTRWGHASPTVTPAASPAAAQLPNRRCAVLALGTDGHLRPATSARPARRFSRRSTGRCRAGRLAVSSHSLQPLTRLLGPRLFCLADTRHEGTLPATHRYAGKNHSPPTARTVPRGRVTHRRHLLEGSGGRRSSLGGSGRSVPVSPRPRPGRRP